MAWIKNSLKYYMKKKKKKCLQDCAIPEWCNLASFFWIQSAICLGCFRHSGVHYSDRDSVLIKVQNKEQNYSFFIENFYIPILFFICAFILEGKHPVVLSFQENLIFIHMQKKIVEHYWWEAEKGFHAYMRFLYKALQRFLSITCHFIWPKYVCRNIL